MASADQDSLSAHLRLATMNALARREHSRAELEDKLAARFGDHPALIKNVLDKLAEEGLQSDSRFAEAYCRSKSSRGYGQRYILNALRLKGITDDDGRQIVASLDVDWFALALNVLNKKFAYAPVRDVRDKAKRVRFLQYRGFTSDQIRYAVDSGGVD